VVASVVERMRGLNAMARAIADTAAAAALQLEGMRSM